ncbi:MAG: hypothetical protein RSB93_03070 [Rikenellaceae bacterium]
MKITNINLIIALIVKKIIFAVIAMFFFTSCVDRNDFELKSINSVSIKETTMNYITLDIDVTAINNSHTKASIKKSDLKVYSSKGKELCEAFLEAPIIIKKGVYSTKVPLKITFNGGIFGAARLVTILSKDIDDLYFSGHVKVKKGIVTKNITIEKMKISDLK